MSWREDMDDASWDAWDDEQSAQDDASRDGPLPTVPTTERADSEDES